MFIFFVSVTLPATILNKELEQTTTKDRRHQFSGVLFWR